MLFSRSKLIRYFFAIGKRNNSTKSENTFENFSSDIKNKDVYEQYQKQVQQDSILRKFRRDVFKKQQISQQIQALKQDEQKESHMLNDLLHRGSKQDIMKYSKKIMQKLMNKKKVFKDQTLNPVFSDYGDYSSYRSNFVKIQDRNLTNLERLDQQNHHQNLYKFIDQLPDNYQEKQIIRQHIKQDLNLTNLNMSISDYGKIIQQRADQEIHLTQAKQHYYQTYRQGTQRIYRTLNDYIQDKTQTPQRRTDLNNGAQFPCGRLSPHAMDTIYQCYLQGWTVRDISRRFGILPKRTKFCIWARAQLYDQLLPKYGWKYYHDALRSELEIGQQQGYVDYGLDLDVIQSQRIPNEIVEWNHNRVDAQRKQQQYTQALQKLQKLQKFDRHQKLQVGTHGKQNKMYFLKQWTIFRGKGSDQYHLRNHTFRKLSKAQKKMVKQYY